MKIDSWSDHHKKLWAGLNPPYSSDLDSWYEEPPNERSLVDIAILMQDIIDAGFRVDHAYCSVEGGCTLGWYHASIETSNEDALCFVYVHRVLDGGTSYFEEFPIEKRWDYLPTFFEYLKRKIKEGEERLENLQRKTKAP